jgi:hypothetical protein
VHPGELALQRGPAQSPRLLVSHAQPVLQADMWAARAGASRASQDPARFRAWIEHSNENPAPTSGQRPPTRSSTASHATAKESPTRVRHCALLIRSFAMSLVFCGKFSVCCREKIHGRFSASPPESRPARTEKHVQQSRRVPEANRQCEWTYRPASERVCSDRWAGPLVCLVHFRLSADRVQASSRYAPSSNLRKLSAELADQARRLGAIPA